MQNTDTFRLAYSKAVARAWSDAAYKGRLLNDAKTALSEVGLDVPDDFQISVVEDSQEQRHFVLPAPPPEGEVGDDVLERASGGACCFCCWWW